MAGRLGATAVALALLLSGCGDNGETATSSAPSPATELTVVVAGPIGSDPLTAEDRSTQFALRQVYEPLVASVDPPFGRAGRRKGLALGLKPASGATVWVARLRDGVRFSDGTIFNASAVAANARRWAAEAPELLPELVTADAPRSDRVRFILSEPVSDLAERLGDPRLGIVTPRAFRLSPNGSIRFLADAAIGTGPFVIEGTSGGELSLARNQDWWGTGLRLGPALRRVEFEVEPDPGLRVATLAAGQAQIADQLGEAPRSVLRELRDDPLLSRVDAAGSVIGVERSLRGLPAGAEGTPLSGAWLTSIDQPAAP